jgi:PPOX class probable F420-dependent enzyme
MPMPFTDAQRDFLAAPRYGTVATLRADGSPSLFTVWYDVDGDDIWFVTRQDLAKLRHIERDPRVAFHVVDPSGYPYVAVNGTATISIDEDYRKRLHMASRYRGPEGGKRYLVENPLPKPPAVVRIKVERVQGMER